MSGTPVEFFNTAATSSNEEGTGILTRVFKNGINPVLVRSRLSNLFQSTFARVSGHNHISSENLLKTGIAFNNTAAPGSESAEKQKEEAYQTARSLVNMAVRNASSFNWDQFAVNLDKLFKKPTDGPVPVQPSMES